MNLAHLLDTAMTAVDRAAQLMTSERLSATTAKGDRDMATNVDYAVEHEVRRMLAEATPSIGFLGEEEGGTNNGGLMWCLDPIDGTANFIHRSPLCGISLGLLDGPRAVVAVIDLPFLGNRYHAVEHQGAYRDRTPIHVSDTTQLHDAIVAVGDYAVGDDADGKNRLRLGVTNALASRVQRVRMFGSAAIDLAWLADGKVDAMLMLNSNNPWDTSAGVLLAREAGARITDRYGTQHDANSRDTIGANPLLLPELLAIVQQTDV